MAKLTGPLLSFGAKGQIAKTMVVSTWRGVKYAKQYTIPANPNTVAQQGVRGTFAMLREMWKLMSADARAPWDSFSLGRPFTGVNALVGENMRVINGDADMTDFLGSPGARGGIGASLIAFAPGGLAGEIDVVFTDPALPAGWAITDHIVLAFPDQDPAVDFVGPFTEGSDAAANPTVTLTGLTGGTDYLVTAWLVETKPDGSTAYSPSWSDIITATP
jgi:hypothetical protein